MLIGLSWAPKFIALLGTNSGPITTRADRWLDVLIALLTCGITVHQPTVSDNGLFIAIVPFLYETPIHVEGLLRN